MKKFTVRFLNEEAITQPAIVSGDTTQEQMMNKEDDSIQTDLVANVTPTLQEQDVDGLEDKDVMNYVYFNAPQDIDDGTRQALFNRADQIRQKQMNGSTTPKDQEEFAKGVIAAAAQTKDKATLGEAYSSGRVDTFNEPSWEDMEGNYDEEDSTDDNQNEQVPSIDELRQFSDELKRSTLLEDLKEAVADKIDGLTNGEYNYNRIYDVVDKYITNAHKKYNTKEIEKYSRVYGGKVDFFAKIILTKFKKQISLH